ncbi:hypothetical protein HHUSO_G12766 [Huso huso]|uniref:C2H2-type domain-containing protein n=1 Tax=Huso huso TaxID=61971 RepID=A0ABR0ZJU3_HUSHU
MYRCFICKSLHQTSTQLFRHIKLSHGMYSGNKLRLNCAQEGCGLQFCSYSGFRHLNNIHNNDEDNGASYSEGYPASTEPRLPEIPLDTGLPHAFQTESSHEPQSPTTAAQSQEMCASILAKLLGSGVPNTVVLSMVKNLEEYVSDLQSNLKDQVMSLVPSDNPSRSSLEDMFENIKNHFSNLNSDSKFKKYFSKKWGVVQPIELCLGVRFDTKRNRRMQTYEQVPVNDKFIYVPILKTLQFIFKNADICDFIVMCPKRQA